MLRVAQITTLSVLLAAGPPPALAADSPPDEVRSTRETMARWVETQQLLSRERRDWQVAKDVLEQRIALIEGEIAALEPKLAATRAQLAEIEAKGGALAAETGSLRRGTAALDSLLASLETKTVRLLAAVPDPLREHVAPLGRRIPSDPAATRLTFGERFQNVIGILNEVDKFSLEITLANEVRPLPDGRTAEVQTLYLGLGQAFYVTPDGKTAGVGRALADGWAWTAAGELAPAVARAIAILKNEQVPAYVPLPVQIQ